LLRTSGVASLEVALVGALGALGALGELISGASVLASVDGTATVDGAFAPDENRSVACVSGFAGIDLVADGAAAADAGFAAICVPAWVAGSTVH